MKLMVSLHLISSIKKSERRVLLAESPSKLQAKAAAAPQMLTAKCLYGNPPASSLPEYRLHITKEFRQARLGGEKAIHLEPNYYVQVLTSSFSAFTARQARREKNSIITLLFFMPPHVCRLISQMKPSVLEQYVYVMLEC